VTDAGKAGEGPPTGDGGVRAKYSRGATVPIQLRTSARQEEQAMFRHTSRWLAVAGLVSLVLAACSSSAGSHSAPSSSEAAGGDPSSDMLARIQDRGTLVGYAELDYPPQSIRVEDATRPATTKCQQDQLTGAEVSGYDIETNELVAADLGVEPCFARPTWAEVTGGNWGDRWDIAYGSGSINADRMTRLWMTQPYYATPNRFFVRADSPIQAAAELSGKEVGSCASCTHEAYLKRELVIPGVELTFAVDDPEIVVFETERPGLQAVADGEIEAFLCAEPVGEAMIEEGVALRALDPPAFTFFPSGFVDKSSAYDQTAFVERVTEIIKARHADGTLKALSEEWFGVDYASEAAAFDLNSIGQVLP
jgi:polar amino acid transport system substrate-binding protein